MRVEHQNTKVLPIAVETATKEPKAGSALEDKFPLLDLNHETLVEVLTFVDPTTQIAIGKHLRNKRIQEAWFDPSGCVQQHRLRKQILAEPAQIPALLAIPRNNRILNNWDSFDFCGAPLILTPLRQ